MSQERRAAEHLNLTLIAVGSNAPSPWGDAVATVNAALIRLENAMHVTLRRSGLYQTPAFPAGAGPDFVNGAVAVATDLTPQAVLAILHDIEHDAQRTRAVRWGQRTLDLDLIACGDAVLPDEDGMRYWLDLPAADQQTRTPDQLILPHPRLQDRAFVLRPLTDVAPDWLHPVLGLSVVQMLARCSADDRASVVPLF